ncbi:hypothetical protein CH64_2096 [Yersinia rohdei]|uniref:YagK/YfjJ C-terminal domain-containing protein n=1 Tax=Yersinia rohdei TaxID=29485 RepID=A0ABN4F7D2_YERRO|nr:inovirus Gp2 family protein [Yersinia rohdei]AJJ12632.1 hypothetical protein CH64_2096 [Yersinia rohdei]EEQ03117.1 hypothetical protein yrohd0001_17360 [Yersinia rohdei ATCC 43380]
MHLYNGTHGEHIFDYKIKIEQTLNNAIRQYPRTMALRVDLHYPPILDRGDTISCFHNQEPGAISRFLNALKATLSASEDRRMRDGTRIHPNTLRNIWGREFTLLGKCHFHICLLFNKHAYYHLGDFKYEDSLGVMIMKAWYSALGLTFEDCPQLVHFPDNCRYMLEVNDPDYVEIYYDLLNRLDYMTKLDTKVFGEGDRNFGCSRG